MTASMTAELTDRIEYLEGLIDFLYDHVPNIEDLETLYEESLNAGE